MSLLNTHTHKHNPFLVQPWLASMPASPFGSNVRYVTVGADNAHDAGIMAVTKLRRMLSGLNSIDKKETPKHMDI